MDDPDPYYTRRIGDGRAWVPLHPVIIECIRTYFESGGQAAAIIVYRRAFPVFTPEPDY